MIDRAGRARPPRRRAVLALAAKAASARRRQRRLERLRLLHTAAARVGGLDLGFVPGAGGLDAGIAAQGAARRRSSSLAPTRSTCAPGAFVIYQARMAIAARAAPTSSCRAPPIPRSPDLRQHRGPGAAAERAVFPPGDAREDWAILRALPMRWASRCPSIRCASARGSCSRPSASSPRDEIAPGCGHIGARVRGGAPASAPFVSPIARFLSHQSDRARVARRWRNARRSPRRETEAAEYGPDGRVL